MAREAGTLLGDLATTGLGVLVYGALFAFIGLAMKKPLFWGLIIGFGWENLVAWLPGFLKRLTILFHLHTLLPHPTAPQGLLNLLASSREQGGGHRLPRRLRGRISGPGRPDGAAHGSPRPGA